MARDVRELQVLVSSPSDVAAEREAAIDVVHEVNRLYASGANLRLESVAWESHSRPGVGTDAQDVLNRQLPSAYDIYLGILWSRFGTATGRADSGTEEEFDAALGRHRTRPGEVAIMVYFKTAKVDIDAIDPEQLRKVRAFKQRLVDEGVLYREFTTTDHFTTLLRTHFIDELREYAKRQDQPAPTEQFQLTSLAEIKEDDSSDLGFLDLVELSTERLAAATAAAQRLAEATQSLGQATTERTAQLNELNTEHGIGTPNLGGVKRVFKRMAEDLDVYATRTEAEIPGLVARTMEAVQSFAELFAIAQDFGPEGEEGSRQGAVTLAEIDSKMSESLASISGLRDVLAKLPRAQRDFNVARRRAVSVLDKLIQGLGESVTLVREIRRGSNVAPR